jgi:hypothetical protein
MSYGVLHTGFNRKPLATILAEIENANIATFGPGVIQTSQSPLGQLNGLFADLVAQLWEFAEDTYQSYDPDQAEGVRLDTLAKLRIISRGESEDDVSLRQAITNTDRARIDLQDLLRAVAGMQGVTYAQVFVNDSDATDANGLDAHSVAVAVIGGDDEEIARTVRQYVVPGIGTSGNVRVDTNIEGVCRSIFIVRPVPVSIKLSIVVNPRPGRDGCPPPSTSAIAAGLLQDLQTGRRLINGEDVTLFAVRSAIEARYPNVEVVSAVGDRDVIDGGSSLPVAISFYEIASFALADIAVSVAP